MFLVEAGLLVALMPRHAGATLRVGRRVLGWLLAAGGVVLYPLATALAGHSWKQAEVAGMMPEPTALATLGFLLVTGHRHRRWLSAIPALSLILGLATRGLLWVRIRAAPAAPVLLEWQAPSRSPSSTAPSSRTRAAGSG